MSGFMTGKRGLIMGVANERSIAWGIAKALHENGAELAFTYQGDALEKRVRPLAAKIGAEILLPCDVTDDASIDNLFDTLGEKWGKFDFIVHAIAFSDKNELDGLYLNTTRDNFLKTMDISVFSFTKIAQKAAPLLNEGGSLVTASDLGKDGVRVNAISAGPIKTLAASGIGDFRYILKWNELNSPLKRNVTIDEVGNSALYLLSDLGSGVTGEVLHVDSGYHTVGMVSIDSAAETAELLSSIAPKVATEAAE